MWEPGGEVLGQVTSVRRANDSQYAYDLKSGDLYSQMVTLTPVSVTLVQTA